MNPESANSPTPPIPDTATPQAMPPQPQPVPVAPPAPAQPTTQPQPVTVTTPETIPAQPIVMPAANSTPMLQSQPQVVQPTVSLTPATGKTSSKKILWVVMAIIMAVVIAVVGFFAYQKLSGGKEVGAGSDYIVAIQTKDIASLERLSDPALVQLGDKVGRIGGDAAKQGFYRQYATTLAKEAGIESISGKPKNLKVVKGEDNGTKYAFLTYRLGSKNVSVIEGYSGSEPKPIIVESGLQNYSGNKFASDYQDYRNQMSELGKIVDQIAAGAGSNSQRSIEQLFTTE
jgi:hypothetical protein